MVKINRTNVPTTRSFSSPLPNINPVLLKMNKITPNIFNKNLPQFSAITQKTNPLAFSATWQKASKESKLLARDTLKKLKESENRHLVKPVTPVKYNNGKKHK